MFSFDGKLVVVTGGEKGIGKGIVKVFVENGAKAVILGRNIEAAEKTIEELGKDKVGFIQTDISDADAVSKVPDIIEKQFGLTDILINNAGIVSLGNVTETSIETWDQVMNVNLRGTFLTTKYLIPHMLKKKKGVIVNIASEAGLSAFKNQVAYNTSKAAVIHFTKSVAVDYAKDNIRANIVCPGTTYTPLVQGLIKSGVRREDMESIRPLNRLGDPSEIANAVLCLSSDELSYATGAVLSIDGGYTIQ
ncbi:SDR family NAD(P)-dependent oxidoreductase [Ethanoligenens sp.]|uniref:SDR family NAD(P)-dependent oxidoreductase n=1 Tax=Ethanoligenens sp. TaxID=2099655 RepID=UPI0039E82969